METKIFTIDPLNFKPEDLEYAASVINAGGLVGFPTETVYGLGADADNELAVKSIYKAKGRPSDNPLIVHVDDIALCEKYVQKIPRKAEILMGRFWGGPLTIIMKKSKHAKDCVTAGLDTVAVRMPSHPVAHELIKASKTGIVAPSANISGRPSPTVAEHVIKDFNGKIDCIINSGATRYGLESTVIDMSMDVPTVLRPGAVSLEMIREMFPDAVYGGGGTGTPKSPGMKYKHYAPKAKVTVIKGEITKAFEKSAENVAVIDYDYNKDLYKGKIFLPAGCDDSDYGARLFYLLRKADEEGAQVIFAADPKGGSNVTDALRNRLYKSAAGEILVIE
ncbi:MAG: L-threonylcarbamoyladenylate synthase [Bacillota bacterium]|nr:L-threonylcarbamoyladenylate synthase [Bacillota bacterium]